MINDLTFKIIFYDSSMLIQQRLFPSNVWDSTVVYRCSRCIEYVVFALKKRGKKRRKTEKALRLQAVAIIFKCC